MIVFGVFNVLVFQVFLLSVVLSNSVGFRDFIAVVAFYHYLSSLVAFAPEVETSFIGNRCGLSDGFGGFSFWVFAGFWAKGVFHCVQCFLSG